MSEILRTHFLPMNPARAVGGTGREVDCDWPLYDWTSGVFDFSAVRHNLMAAGAFFPGSLINSVGMCFMKHPKIGKAWGSVFITVEGEPLSQGISITWWHKGKGARGRFNVKRENIGSWHKQLLSKLKGGYDLNALIGGHPIEQQISEWLDGTNLGADRPFCAMPIMSVIDTGFDKTGRGKIVGRAMKNIVPINHFFSGLLSENSSGSGLDSVFKEMKDLFTPGSTQSDFIFDLISELTTEDSEFDQQEREALKASIDKNRAETMPAWGLFG